MGNMMQVGDLSELRQSVDIFSRRDTDMADRLNNYTAFILFWFATIVMCEEYVGEPIQCWTPQHFKKIHDTYTNNICWTRNTYYLPFDEPLDKSDDSMANRHTIVYYQWIPIILLMQAFLFCLPRIFWTTFADHSGIDVGSLAESGELLTSFQMDSSVRNAIIKRMTLQVDRYLWSSHGSDCKRHPATISVKHVFSQTCFRKCGVQYANYLFIVYLITKLLYIANAVGQLFALNAFLGSSFSSYGIDVLIALVNGEDWVSSKRFPRVTMCDLNVRRLGNLNQYTVQCVLPINLFNEKIFLFLWFWFVLVAIVTTVTALSWIFHAAKRSERHHYVRKFLNIAGKIKLREEFYRKMSVQFIDEYLRQDGVFMLRLLSGTTNGLTVMDVIASLWDNYYEKPQLRSLAVETDAMPFNKLRSTSSQRRPTTFDNIADETGLPDYHSLDHDDNGTGNRGPSAPSPSTFE